MTKITSILALITLFVCPAMAQDEQASTDPNATEAATELTSAESTEAQTTFGDAAAVMDERLAQALEDLTALRERILAEKMPLAEELSALEAELSEARATNAEVSRNFDSRKLEVANLERDITTYGEDATFLTDLLSEYTRNFESRLHIAEAHRYEKFAEEARLAPENTNLTQDQIYAAQAALLRSSLDRLEDALGATKFEGSAILGESGELSAGSFVLVGPAAIFRSHDGRVGTIEQRINSHSASQVPFADAADEAAAEQLVATTGGYFPLDPTLGNATKVEATQETWLEHVQKGGKVMYPIFGLAALALLVALYKFIALMLVRTPTNRQLQPLLSAVAAHDERQAAAAVRRIRGPVGKMLESGVRHIREPRDLIEEVMYERVLTSRLKLQGMLPFISITAAAAPLLGLLGTVTGIINTFKLLTVYGSGDVKNLSGGISEALITTEYGLIVAIPALLLHGFLSRKARAVVNRMETTAVAFANAVSTSPFGHVAGAVARDTALDGEPNRVNGTSGDNRAQEVREALVDLLTPDSTPSSEPAREPAAAASA